MAPASARTQEETWERCLQQDKVGPLEPEEIIEACRLVARMDYMPLNVINDAFNNIGVAYMRLNQVDKAISMFTEALRKMREMPDSREVRQLSNYTRRNRALAFVAVKQYGDALNDFDTMASAEPQPKYQGLRCRAHALYDDDFAVALPDCLKAIAATKYAEEAITGWVIIEYRQGKYADVKTHCAQIQSERKSGIEPDAQYVCGLADRRLGETERGDNYINAGRHEGMMFEERFRELGMVP
jgi:tetratricopeptide (TPR) repeat protein